MNLRHYFNPFFGKGIRSRSSSRRLSKYKGYHFFRSNILLIEWILIGCIGIVFLFIAFAIRNPERRTVDSRNLKRFGDVRHIFELVTQRDNQSIRALISMTNDCGGIATNEICRSDAPSCKNLVDLSSLLSDDSVFPSLSVFPLDPKGAWERGTGYYITKDERGHITVCAPHAEGGAYISVTR